MVTALRFQYAAWVLSLLVFGSTACAAPLKLNQLDHRSWTVKDGAPSKINRIAEAADGTLWLATDSGLYHFDGIHFMLFEPATGEPQFPSPSIAWDYVSRDNTLWIGFWGSGAVAAIHRGHVQLYGPESGLPGGIRDEHTTNR